MNLCGKYAFETIAKEFHLIDSDTYTVYIPSDENAADLEAPVEALETIRMQLQEKGTVILEKDDGQWVYEVKFDAKGYHYEYDVHGRTGKILEYSKESF